MAKAIQRRKKNLFGFGDSRKRTRAQEQADRLGERTRIASSRMETAGRGLKSSKPVAEKTYRYEGETITKRGDEYWLADGSAFESLAVAKRVIRSLKKNPMANHKISRDRAEARADRHGTTRYFDSYGESVTNLKYLRQEWGLGEMYRDGDGYVVFAWTPGADSDMNERERSKNPQRGSHYQDAVVSSVLTHSPFPLGAEILRNPAKSAAQYRLAQAVLSGTARETGMSKAAAREIVGRTPAKMRKIFMKKNPEDAAEELYEKFHGVPSEESIVVEEEHHYHSNLTALGVLIEMKVKTVIGPRATLRFSHKGTEDTVYLAANEAGTQIFCESGDQTLDLEALGFDESWRKEQIVIGVLKQITYRTSKAFDKLRETDYFHNLGEEKSVQPLLVYDSVNEKLLIVGGRYSVRPEGLVD